MYIRSMRIAVDRYHDLIKLLLEVIDASHFHSNHSLISYSYGYCR